MTTTDTSPSRLRPAAPIQAPPGSAEPRVVGERTLAAFDGPLRRLESAVARAMPADLDPLAQSGAIVNTCLIVAIVTGIALLLWYVPSVHQAYTSMLEMEASPWTAGLVRSLHRYSSDACILFVLVHATQIVLRRRFTGARWLAWVTGLVGLAGIWLIGWLGYWLVWDQPAQQVALGTARMLDVLPVFIDPMSRSFVADGSINSLLFFVIFFGHMLLPVALGVALWLHIARLSRARFLARRRMSAWIVASLIAVSLLWPAAVAGPAKMAQVPESFSMDWWYLAPLALTDRLGGGMLWLVLLVPGLLALSVPWWARRGKIRAAIVEPSRCNACTQCSRDCPYGAIQMVPRTDGKAFDAEAYVDPARCVGCGICTGSCDSTGVGLPWMPTTDLRLTVDSWLEKNPGSRMVFACSHSAGGDLRADPLTGVCSDLPDTLVLAVPCAGWVHMLSVERAQRRGAREVVILGCGEGGCRYREGMQWTEERLDGGRKPKLRTDKADRSRVRLVAAGAGERKRMLEALRSSDTAPRAGRARTWVVGLVMLIVALTLLVTVSNLGYSVPANPEPCLVVSFKHTGEVDAIVHELSAEELAKLPVHMRPQRQIERRRSAVRLRVVVDGTELLNRSYEPKGIWHDGNSIGIEELYLTPGFHDVEIAIGDTPDPLEWNQVTTERRAFTPRHREVVTFDRNAGFTWH